MSAQLSVTAKVHDVLWKSDGESIKGYLQQKLDSSYRNRILAQDEPRLIEPFRHPTEDRCWQSEFWGKWFTSAVMAYRYRPEPELKALLDKAVTDLLSTQHSDGYIGNYAADKHLQQWDIWGRKYCLLGLLAYYDLVKDNRSLQAAQLLTDHLIRELKEHKMMISKQGNHRGMAATSVLEPVCLLYRQTGNKNYLNFATEIVRQWETPDGPQLISKSNLNVAERFPKPSAWWGWEQGQKAYEMMSCYEGLLEIYRLTGRPEYKAAVVKTWENIMRTEINIAGSGSGMECWFAGKSLQVFPVKHYQETCVTATWIKLSQQLLRLTGEAKYADAIEQSYYNALIGAMKTDGSDWAKYSPLSGQREQGEEQCGMGINCCVASGPRGLFALPGTIVMNTREGIQVNFFTEGSYKFSTPKKQLAEVVQQTNYPVDGKVVLKVVISNKENFSLCIRIPSWSKVTALTVNKEPINKIVPGTYALINRTWKDGDEIELNLDMRGRITKLKNHPEFIAVSSGPLLLCRDIRLGGPDINEVLTPILNNDGFLDLEPAGTDQQNIWLQYKARFIVGSSSSEDRDLNLTPVLLCNYSSAGNTINQNSRFKVWLPQLINADAKE